MPWKMLLVFLTILVVFIGLICKWYYVFFKYNSCLSKYNGPTPLPIVGNIHKTISNRDIIPTMMDCIKEYGPVIKFWVGFRPRIIIAGYKTAALLLESTELLDKSWEYRFLEPWLGKGLLTSTGSTWKMHRKLLTPAFHFKILETYLEIFNKNCDIMVRKLDKLATGKAFDICPLINLCALDIVYESVMGVQIHAQEDDKSEYIQNIKEIARVTFTRMMSPFKSFDFYFKFTKDSGIEQRAISMLHGHTNFIIQSREKELLSIKHEPVKEDCFGIRKRQAFLDLMLQARKVGADLTIANIREQVETFMFEGHDTTSSGLVFAVYCLAQNPKYQAKAAAEIYEVLNKSETGNFSYNDLHELKYLEKCIKESMRLYPPVAMIARQLPRDMEFDGVSFPKGMHFALFVYGLHRQEEIFPDPENYNPERFSPEISVKRPPFSYAPFSAGPRNCIGQRFAMQLMKVLLAKLLLNFEILPVEGFVPMINMELILRSENGIRIRLKRRKM